MAYRYQIFLVLVGLFIGGFVHAQEEESGEAVEAVQPGLAQVLKPNQQGKPADEAERGDTESGEEQAGAPLGTGEQAGGTNQEGVPFFEAGGPPKMAATGGAEAESNEAEGAALGATAEQNEGGEEEEAQLEAEEVADQGEGDAEAEGGAEVVGGGEAEDPQTGNGGNSPFFNMNGGQQDGQEQADQGEGEGAQMEEGDAQEAAEMGGAEDESGEAAQAGAIGGTQNDGDNTESGEVGGAVGQQGGEEAESAEEVDAGVPSLLVPSVSEAVSSRVFSDGGVPPSKGSAVEEEGQPKPFVKPKLASSPLAEKAKQVAPTGMTMKPETPTPTAKVADEETEEESSGLSDSYKTRIGISVASVGAVVVVGVVAYLIGRNVSRRPHTGSA